MKKLLILSLIFPLIFLSCLKEPDPEPEVKRAYCYLHNFMQGQERVVWEAAGHEVPDAQLYSSAFPGSIILQEDMEEITFRVKKVTTKEELYSQIVQLEKDIYYNVIVGGTAEDPEFIVREIDTKNHPVSGNVKFQVMNAIPGQDSIDVYMGGTTENKKLVSGLEYFDLSDPFETSDYDARTAITISKHTETYEQDSVLLSSLYNSEVISSANHFMIVAPVTFEAGSDLTLWIYNVPLEY